LNTLAKFQNWLKKQHFIIKLLILGVLRIVIELILDEAIDFIPELILQILGVGVMLFSNLLWLTFIVIFIRNGIFRVPYPNGDDFDWSIESSIGMIIFSLYLEIITIQMTLELFFDFEPIIGYNEIIYMTAFWLGSWVILVYFEHIDLLKEEDWAD